ncbi:MAG: filamentous hemagglutinin N-terminal domain-containing protein [Cyanobacteriota bacterium]|nr:filamentous hemagglutinin N-terminal domain-containing protein [Cyanobacteriota bacterium]
MQRWIYRSAIALQVVSIWGAIEGAALAQIVPDTTLPNNSQVNLEDAVREITGGTERGANLFHSFREFNVQTGETAFFDNGMSIDNIITRVTGGNLSNIDGLIRANGTANLFLVNPNGIQFGPNARLDIGGSFLGSTADRFLFDDGSFYSATDTAQPLLSINVPIGLQFGANPGDIQVSGAGTGRQEISTNGTQEADFLNSLEGPQVSGGETLGLVGGNINLSGGLLEAPQGRIELGSVGENQRVTIEPTPNMVGFSLDYSETNNFRDISLSQQAGLFASGNPNSRIQVRARNLSVTEGSEILTANFDEQPPGTIALQATDSIDVSGESLNGIRSRATVLTFGTVDASTNAIEIDTRNLSIRDGGAVETVSWAGFLSEQIFGGTAGGITVRAADSVEVSGTLMASNGEQPSFLRSQTRGTSQAGNVNITTRRLSVMDGGEVSANTQGIGNAGNLTIAATDSIEINGTSILSDGSRGLPSVLGTATFIPRNDSKISGPLDSRTGNAGDVTIETGRLTVTEGGQIVVFTDNVGQVGNITITAPESVSIVGAGSSLQATNVDDTISDPDRTSIQITTGQFTLSEGGRVSASTNGLGSAGGIKIDATESVVITGVATDTDGSLLPSSVLAETTSTDANAGEAGEISINIGNMETGTGRFVLSNGGEISASTEGFGGVGKITVNAGELVNIIGPDSSLNAANVDGPISDPDGISIDIDTQQFAVRDGGLILTETTGSGNAGTIDINAPESVVIDANSGLFGITTSSGDAGDIAIGTGRLVVSEESVVFVATGDSGEAGEIDINATDSVDILGAGSLLLAGTTSSEDDAGDASSITIDTGRLTVRDGGEVVTRTIGAGNAGRIVINATESVNLDSGSGLFAETTSNANNAGNANSITIDTGELLVQDGSQIGVSTSGAGGVGTIDINATDSVEITGSDSSLLAINVNDTRIGPRPPSVQIHTEQFTLSEGATITTFTVGSGPAGEIVIDADESVELSDRGSAFFAATFASGNAGNVTINTEEFLAQDGAVILVASLPLFEDVETGQPGIPGNININAENILVRDNGFLAAFSRTGKGGGITLNAQDVLVRGQSGVLAYGDESEDATDGSIDITSNILILFQNSSAVVTQDRDPRGGSNVTVQAQPNSGLGFFLCNTCRIGADGTLLIFDEIEDPTVIVSDPLNVGDLVREDVCVTGTGSEFYVAPRGGIPPSPLDMMVGESLVTLDWVEFPEDLAETGDDTEIAEIPIPEEQPTLIEAQGWQVGENGEIILTADPHVGTSYTPGYTPALEPIRCEDLRQGTNLEERG